MADNPLDHDGDGKAGGTVAAKIPKVGRPAVVRFPDASMPSHAGVITRLDADGSFNVSCFTPESGGPFFTGLRTKAYRDGLAPNDPELNLPWCDLHDDMATAFDASALSEQEAPATPKPENA